MAKERPSRLSPTEGRRFAFTLAAAFAALAAHRWWRERRTAAAVLGAVAAAFALAGVLLPGRLGSVYRAWMGFAHAISRVTTPIFMGVVYFLVITSIGAVRRTIGGNPLRTHQAGSGWVDRQKAPRGDLTRQF